MRLIKTIKSRDPSVHSWLEVILYPGLWAMFNHRIAHFMYRLRLFFLARLVSQISRFFTGIEIHPGAKIGRGVFIDGGSGVVIGETCIIGDDVLISRAVILGAVTREKAWRHPIIGNNVTIGAGALIMGAINIGDNAKISAGATVFNDVPAGKTVAAYQPREPAPKPEPQKNLPEAGQVQNSRSIEYVAKRIIGLKVMIDNDTSGS